MTTYKEAGVDVTKADRLVEHLQLEGFGAVIELEGVNPTIVMSCDGVGTKILVAEAKNDHSTVGIDLVAMCTNDLLCQGARPHSFLDYYATGAISLKKSREIMDGILEGCKLAKCKLVGGETAELPGMYVNHRYDLAGFAMGIMEKMLPLMTQGGEYIVGIPSSGAHSNAFSLLRKLIPIMEIPLTPTRTYTDEIMNNLEHINGAAHITGGGIHGNISRILHGHDYELNLPVHAPNTWWGKLRTKCKHMSDYEFESTFNCGWGMLLVVDDPSKLDIDDMQVLGRVI
tara:strand:- start:99 stop:956 length:858 start_codon:yes stop_codon:yes gene_type:complete